MNTVPLGGLPRRRPALKATLDALSFSAEALFSGTQLLVASGRGGRTLFRGVQLSTGGPGLEALRPPRVRKWSGPGGGGFDGIGVLGFVPPAEDGDEAEAGPSDDEGISLYLFDVLGNPTRRLPTGFDFSRVEGPEWSPGPGPMFAPVSLADGGWLVCAAESSHDAAPWQVASFGPGGTAPRWTSTGYLIGATGGTVVLARGERSVVGLDAATGAVRWTGALPGYRRSLGPDGLVAGIDSDVRDVQVKVLDGETGREVLSRAYPSRSANLAAGLVWPTRARTLVQSFHDGALYLLDAAGGERRFEAFPAEVLAFDGELLLAADERHRFSARPADAPDRVLWDLELPMQVLNAPTALVGQGDVLLAPLGLEHGWLYG